MAAFSSLYSHDFIRIAACVPQGRVADPDFALHATLQLAEIGHENRTALMLFPELGLSSYAIDDLLFQDALLESVERTIDKIATASRKLFPVLVVGAPLRIEGRLFNTAIIIHRGDILGIVPKTYLPNYREFYERRHFTSGAGIVGREATIAGRAAPFGVDLLFRSVGFAPFVFHVEICEDIWTPLPPSTYAALAGAEALLNLSASNITIGKADARRLLCASQSSRAIAAYAYSAAGPGESTTDLAWDGHAAVLELGDMVAETERFPAPPLWPRLPTSTSAGCGRSGRGMNSFGDCAHDRALGKAPQFRTASFELEAPAEPVALKRTIERFPFVPANPARLRADCYEAYNIPVQGLAQRLAATGGARAVIGVSGGLDSTQALIVAARAMDPARPLAQGSARLYAARLCDLGGDQGQCLGAHPLGRRDRR